MSVHRAGGAGRLSGSPGLLSCVLGPVANHSAWETAVSAQSPLWAIWEFVSLTRLQNTEILPLLTP